MDAYVFRSPHGCLFSQYSKLLTQGGLFLLTALFCLPAELSALWKFVQRLVCMASCGAFMCHHISFDDRLFLQHLVCLQTFKRFSFKRDKSL
jgi:hypothetical protein